MIELLLPHEINVRLHDAWLDLDSVRLNADRALTLNGTLEANAPEQLGRRHRARYPFRLLFQNVIQFEVDDREGVGIVPLMTVNYSEDDNRLILEGSIPGRLAIIASPPVGELHVSEQPTSVRRSFRWHSVKFDA